MFKIDTHAYQIIFVDDDEIHLKLVEHAFGRQFNILTTTDSKQVLAWINADREDKIAVVVSDQWMPNLTGLSLMQLVKNRKPQILRYLVTAKSDINVCIDAINKGEIFRYIQKPWDREDLAAELSKGLRVFIQHQGIQKLHQILLNGILKLKEIAQTEINPLVKEVVNQVLREIDQLDRLFATSFKEIAIIKNERRLVARLGLLNQAMDSFFRFRKTAQALSTFAFSSGNVYEVVEILSHFIDKAPHSLSLTVFDREVSSAHLGEKCFSLKKENIDFSIRHLGIGLAEIISDKIMRDSYDLVFATSIFNYFSDAVAKVVASNLFQSLKKGGLLLIIFELPYEAESPSEDCDQGLPDKNIIQRSEAEIENLFAFIGGRQVMIKSDSHQYLMLKIEK